MAAARRSVGRWAAGACAAGALLVGCSRGDPAARPRAAARSLDDALPCVVDRVVEQLQASRAPLDALTVAVDVAAVPTSAPAATRYVEAVAHRLASNEQDSPVPAAVVLSQAAFALSEAGALDDAARLADRALASVAGLSAHDRADVVRTSALVLTAAGREPPREVLDGDEAMGKLHVVQGLARSGRADQARALLATVDTPADLHSRGALLFALAWLGDLDAARSIIDSHPPDRGTSMVWFARALAAARPPGASEILDAYLAELRQLAAGATTQDEVMTVAACWSELVWYREKLDRTSSRPARVALHEWLLARDDARRELIGVNVVRAADAGDPVEADRLARAQPAPLSSMARLELALIRDDLAAALDALAVHQRERPALVASTAPPSGQLLDGLENAEGTVWLVLAARPGVDPAVIERFATLACR